MGHFAPRSRVGMATVVLLAGCLVGADPVAGSPPTQWTPVVVQAGQATSGIDIALTQGGSLSGTVVDAQTGDVAYVHVVAIPVADTDHVWLQSDMDGAFTISGIPAKRTSYRVCTMTLLDPGETFDFAPRCYPDVPWDQHHVPAEAQVVTLGPDEHKDLGTLKVHRTGLITGQVTAPSGKPLWGVKVTATSVAKPHARFTAYTGQIPDGVSDSHPDLPAVRDVALARRLDRLLRRPSCLHAAPGENVGVRSRLPLAVLPARGVVRRPAADRCDARARPVR